MQRIPYASDEAVKFADSSMEAVCYYAYQASNELAEERGVYSTYKGSLWDRGILPQDSVAMLAAERGGYVEVDNSSTMDWSGLRATYQATRHAQLKLRSDCANRNDFQHHWCLCLYRANIPELIREI